MYESVIVEYVRYIYNHIYTNITFKGFMNYIYISALIYSYMYVIFFGGAGGSRWKYKRNINI